MLGRECAAMPEYDNITNHGLAVHYINNLIETVDIRSKSNPFAMFYGRPCPKVYLSDDGREFVQKDAPDPKVPITLAALPRCTAREILCARYAPERQSKPRLLKRRPISLMNCLPEFK
ncbi:unnamed protein product [Plutella xylostella]|uniref:(diamondback moth) hypothetical protein n=1 Tax=Plutella xylostella TaxID=51655 RepID=A0A8S4DPP1_PLUXY|nr:unnamed protein product [Plutella xylostella]